VTKPDLAAFDAVQSARRAGQPLRVDAVLAELPPEKAASLRAALSDARYAPRTIAEVVEGQWGVPLSDAAVRTWRRRNGMGDA
jgi:hypothetical protein